MESLTKAEMNEYRLMEELLKASSISQIARDLGKSWLTIYSWLKKYADVSEYYRKVINDRLNNEAVLIDREQELVNSLSNIRPCCYITKTHSLQASDRNTKSPEKENLLDDNSF